MSSCLLRLERIVANPIANLVTMFSTIASLIWYTYNEVLSNPSLFTNIVLGISLFICACFILCSFKIRGENIILRNLGYSFMDINELYNNQLDTLLNADNNPKQQDLKSHEKETLQAVCQRVSKVFSNLIGKECCVTIKMLEEFKKNLFGAYTYARCTTQSNRDSTKEAGKLYKLRNDCNTALVKCLDNLPTERSPHYFSANLLKEKNYTNERQDYHEYYRSTLLVPITADRSGRGIGILAVDTKAINKLNNSFHLDILTALSSQMYNFISIMRGKYKLNCE